MELDRQLGEVRTQADGIATRVGLLMGASAFATGLLGTRGALIPADRLIPAIVALGVAVLIGCLALTPRLSPGPASSGLTPWLSMHQDTAVTLLYQAKLITLGGNRRRLTFMRYVFYTQ